MNATIGPELAIFESAISPDGVPLDVAAWPNPFYGVSAETFVDAGQTELTMVDGGEDGWRSAGQSALERCVWKSQMNELDRKVILKRGQQLEG